MRENRREMLWLGQEMCVCAPVKIYQRIIGIMHQTALSSFVAVGGGEINYTLLQLG
jgi:hypothetical protein